VAARGDSAGALGRHVDLPCLNGGCLGRRDREMRLGKGIAVRTMLSVAPTITVSLLNKADPPTTGVWAKLALAPAEGQRSSLRFSDTENSSGSPETGTRIPSAHISLAAGRWLCRPNARYTTRGCARYTRRRFDPQLLSLRQPSFRTGSPCWRCALF
jgi:hypothetical protein